MMTKEQIEQARENLLAWEDSGLLPAEESALAALAAYERVATLLVRWDTTTARDGGGWEWTAAAELRRALEG